jgi:hypothetical protein
MEAINLTQSAKNSSRKGIWTGRVITVLCVLFLLVDALMKVLLDPVSVDGSGQLGWSEAAVRPIGIVLLVCTILYTIPRTAFIGAILLTGYLGGAIATMARLNQPFYFPCIFAMLIWVGLCLRNEKLRSLL